MAVIAKAKKRRQDQAEALKKADAKVDTRQAEEASKSAVETREVVNIMAVTLQELYAELSPSIKLDDVNAKDKSLVLLRAAVIDEKVKIKEVKMKSRYCKRHR